MAGRRVGPAPNLAMHVSPGSRAEAQALAAHYGSMTVAMTKAIRLLMVATTAAARGERVVIVSEDGKSYREVRIWQDRTGTASPTTSSAA